ncbi:MAG TPA: histidine phosphatase family protein [Casimicrobiaceae bacterium]|nr:histidine phosphatase family protein [Casimicrobiaceae bacterium]
MPATDLRVGRRRFVSVVAAFFACTLTSFAFAQTDAALPSANDALSGPALLNALRRGGYVIYVRHTSTDFGQNDEGMTSYEDCAKQRNLTDQGRAEARAIGAAIAKLQIPIGEVLASPFCRTRETARLIFGRETPSLAVRGGPAATENADRYSDLRKLLSTPVPRGVNLAIASHGNPFRAVAGTPYLAEGEAAVIEPRGKDGFRIVARITKDGWNGLAT